MPISPRSLADDLRGRSDDQILDLLTNRTDLLRPVPASISDLARSANTSGSVSQALNHLSATDLTILEGGCALVPDHRLTIQLLQESLNSEPDQVADSVLRLWGLALLWGPREDLRIPAAVRASMGPEPCGLDEVVRGRDPNAVTLPVAALEEWNALANAPAGTRELLHELIWQNPIMAIHNGAISAPAEWLYRQKVLIPAGESALALPREISLTLRHGRLLPGTIPTEPKLAGRSWPQSLADSTAAHAADLFVRTLDRVVDSLGADPLTLRSRGGLAVRGWRVRAEGLRISESHLALMIEIASGTGWLSDDGSEHLAPTVRYVQAIDAPREDRWATLAAAWYTMPRRPWFDAPDATDIPTATPLSPDLVDEQMTLTKADLLLALVQAQSSISAPTMLSWMEWRRPRSFPSAQVIGEVMAQAEILGITGLGTISPAGVAISAAEPSPLVSAALEPLLPPSDDRLLLQADLTATAPAPLTARCERRLARSADFVSGGGATVYRFTHESIARGLAQGDHADALLAWLDELSDTEIPRAMRVLVGDVARGQGDVRLVPTAAALTGDPETLSKLLASPELAPAGLSRLSATALSSSVPPKTVLSMLRSAGVRVHESAETTPPVQRQHDELPNRPASGNESSLRERVVSALRAIESQSADDGLPATPESSPAPVGVAEQTKLLREATESGSEVWLEFSDASGSMQIHLTMPIEASSGTATVLDRTQNVIQAIPMSRILGVMLAPKNDS
jgi:hypothetical protein